MKTLQDIIEYKKKEILGEKSLFTLSEINELILKNNPPRGFLNSLITNKNKFGIISEVKKASPSKGIIRKDFDHIKIAQSYEKSGATCLSVLTDSNFFQGKKSYIKDIKMKVDLPILRKDFIIDSWQIKQSRMIDADCILLILSCLSFNQAKEYEDEAIDLGMDVIIETHTEKEIELANQLKSKMVGINNRNLKTMDVNILNSIDLIKYLDHSKLAISESGISSQDDITFLHENGFKHFLIGEAFMRQKDINHIFKKIIINN